MDTYPKFSTLSSVPGSQWRQLGSWYLHWLPPSPAYCSLWSFEKPTHPAFFSGLHPATPPCCSFPGSLRQRPQSHWRAPAPSVRSCTSRGRTPWLLRGASPRSAQERRECYAFPLRVTLYQRGIEEQMTRITPHKNSSLRFACSHYSQGGRSEEVPEMCLHHACPTSAVHLRIAWDNYVCL